MTTKQKIAIAIIVGFLFEIGYNLYLIRNGNTNRAVFDGLAVPFGMLIGYYLFGRKKNKESE